MKNTKHQTPNTQQISNTKYPTTREGNGDSRSEWGLRDEPAKNEGGRHPFDFEERTSIFGEKIEEARTLYREATELIRILAAMWRK